MLFYDNDTKKVGIRCNVILPKIGDNTRSPAEKYIECVMNQEVNAKII